MNRANTLKSTYALEYYRGDFQSGLIKWYNKLIDKTVDDLNVTDVAKMIRQNILRDVAIDRAIELFLIEPFDGEMQDGDLLALLVSCGPDIKKGYRVLALDSMIKKLDSEIKDFDWDHEDSRTRFEKNLSELRKLLAL